MDRYVVLDIETQRTANEVKGGWNNIGGFGVAVAAVNFISPNINAYAYYVDTKELPVERWNKAGKYEPALWDVKSLIADLIAQEKIITFNGIHFDYEVLRPYGLQPELLYPKSFDILVEMQKVLGHRVSLESVAQATLGEGKSSDGTQAVKWWKEGKIDKVIEYCHHDVDITQRIYEFIREHGYVQYMNLQGDVRTCKIRLPNNKPIL